MSARNPIADARYNEKRRARRNKAPASFEELSPLQKTCLEYACYGRVLLAGARMAHYRAAAQRLCRMGLLTQEGDGTSFFSASAKGLELYGRRQRQ